MKKKKENLNQEKIELVLLTTVVQCFKIIINL